MNTRKGLVTALDLALGLALVAASCTSDSPDRASDAGRAASASDGGAGSDSAGRDSATDAGVDCDDLVQTPHAQVPRGCIYSIPAGAMLDWSGAYAPYSPIRALSADGGLLAIYEGCACGPNMGFELIPPGADPRTWQLADAGIDTASYDRHCQQDADCSLVAAGDLNFPCFCATASISTSAVAVYQADLVRKRQGGIFDALCACPESGAPVCHEGQCTTSLAIVRLDGGVVPDGGDAALPDASIDGSTM